MSLNEVRRLIDEIRAYVGSVDQTDDQRVALKAREFGVICSDANLRLQRCADLLAKGHRPEAIALAEAEPDLLALVSALTFPELDEWQDLAASYGWERFQPIKHDVAATISEAYAVERQLATLLRRHRRLAVSQAPVADRLAVMRTIADIDLTTPFWQTDLATFEQRRSEELLQMSSAAVQRGADYPLVQKFLTDFEAERWVCPVPERLTQTYNELLVRHHTRYTLPDIAGQIFQAQRSLDRVALNGLKAKWDELAGQLSAALPSWQVPPELRASVQPAFAYLRQQEEHERATAFQRDINSLLVALKADEGAERVDFLLAMAESHGLPLPPVVHLQLAEYRRGAQASKALSIGVIVVLVLTGIAAIVFGFLIMKS